MPGSQEKWLLRIDSDSEDFSVDKDQHYALTLKGYTCFSGSTSPSLTWRLGRAAYKVAAAAEAANNRPKWKSYLNESERLLRLALSMDESMTEAHSWLATVLGKRTDIVSIRERIAIGKEIRDHLNRAIALGANDHLTYYAYGRWCYAVASLTWYERTIAELVFDKVPESTFADAMTMFSKVEPFRPFWAANNYWIANTAVRLKDLPKAKEYVRKAVDIGIHDEEDAVHQSAIAALWHKSQSW